MDLASFEKDFLFLSCIEVICLFILSSRSMAQRTDEDEEGENTARFNRRDQCGQEKLNMPVLSVQATVTSRKVMTNKRVQGREST